MMGHLSVNLEHIALQRGSSEDEAEVLLHCLLERLRGAPNDGRRFHLSSKKGRAEWESAMSAQILRPGMDELQGPLERLRRLASESRNEAENAVEAVLHEREEPVAIERKGLTEHPLFWRPRVAVSVRNVAFKVGQGNLSSQSPNLARLVARGEELALQGALPDVLRLQERLSARFNRKLESGRLEGVSIREFVYGDDFLGRPRRQAGAAEDMDMEDLVKTFIATFNSVQADLFVWGAWGERARQTLQVGFRNSHSPHQYFSN